jgi:hypothetical protein
LPPPSAPLPAEAFSTVSAVKPDDPASWEGRAFLTFDIDWAHDGVLEAAIAVVEQADVHATWFVTHDTPLLARLRANPKFELGLHPNFLPLLMRGDPSNGATAEEVLDRLLGIVPEAKSVRSHSLVQSGRLLELFRDKGLSHEASAFLPEASAMTLKPWTDWFGVIRVPYFWEDDFWCDSGRTGDLAELAARPGIRGFDFHPIHVFLNTDRLSRYESARADFRDPERLRAHVNGDSIGVGDVLRQLLGLGA